MALGTLPASISASTPSSVQVTITDADKAPPTVSLSASPTEVWEGKSSRVTATLSHALPRGVLIPITVKPCPTGSWCERWNDYPIHIPAGSTVAALRGPVDPNAAVLTEVVVDPGDGYGTPSYITTKVYAGPQTSLLTVRDADAEHDEVTVALGSNLPSSVRGGAKTSQKIKVLDPDGFSMTLTADGRPTEGGETVTVTVDLGQPAPAVSTRPSRSSAARRRPAGGRTIRISNPIFR